MTGLIGFPYHAFQAVKGSKSISLVDWRDINNHFSWEMVSEGGATSGSATSVCATWKDQTSSTRITCWIHRFYHIIHPWTLTIITNGSGKIEHHLCPLKIIINGSVQIEHHHLPRKMIINITSIYQGYTLGPLHRLKRMIGQAYQPRHINLPSFPASTCITLPLLLPPHIHDVDPT